MAYNNVYFVYNQSCYVNDITVAMLMIIRVVNDNVKTRSGGLYHLLCLNLIYEAGLIVIRFLMIHFSNILIITVQQH